MTATQTGPVAPTAAGNGTHIQGSPSLSCVPADAPASLPVAGSSVPLGVQIVVDESPYRIDAHALRLGHQPQRLVYAVLDCWGWALMARADGRIRTVSRVELSRWPSAAGGARAEASRRVARYAASWRP